MVPLKYKLIVNSIPNDTLRILDTLHDDIYCMVRDELYVKIFTALFHVMHGIKGICDTFKNYVTEVYNSIHPDLYEKAIRLRIRL